MPKAKSEMVPARACHIPAIATAVRDADRAELWAAARLTPAESMARALGRSAMAWTGLMADRPVCMFGVVPSSILGNVGRPWMVGTRHLDEHPFVFLRRCRGCVGQMRRRFDRLENWVDARNERAIRWLAWLGFEIGPAPEQLGPFGLRFFRFGMGGMR
ncbi:hypothetical protein F6V30_09365 [Oryzomonas sagensis]|uniref:DUF2833 domain-containing protein n=1 Tax=Oryzomonas sagensis TaxID=2603857 RepID=A0ABQ6TNY3_9BACT|nr:hypothetical protein [Oryzomonas sagensis]KAB0670351.1 hypothetical protein F6V30_09365 [Oryzomonas sagensis]